MKKTSKTRKKKNASLRITARDNWTCRMIYGLGGVCHQEANRVLYGMKGHPQLPHDIPGYYSGRVYSRYVYGKYGSGWWNCKRITY